MLTGLFFAVCVHPSDARLIEGKTNISKANESNTSAAVSYRIQPGDNLWSIARRNQVSLASLMSVNGLNENSILDIGEVVKIPSANGNYHIVCAGETMWSIAAAYGLNTAAIENANQDKNPNCLNIGDRLNIPGRSSGQLLQASGPSRGLSFSGMFSWPLTGTITSYFGWRKAGYHHGVDIANRQGTPIKAAADGVVTFAGWKSVYGRTVIIRHNDGKSTLYAHTQKILVKEKQLVKQGQVIARVGVSGNTTGPHLHFEIRKGDKCFNPLSYLNH
ncbi:MAG TPA: M23 family metallopeptidase [Syntrophomonas sp.]|nr:M23 family metallopeptidase [Syntrophomonas sp.]